MARSITIAGSHADNALFKEFYGNYDGEALINSSTPGSSLIMRNKKVDFVGDLFRQPVRFGSAVGVGFRAAGANLPGPVTAPRGVALFQSKRGYATAEFDREAIKASRNDKGAFAKVTVDDVNAAEEGFSLHMVERPLFSDGSGKLGEVGTVDSGAGTTASPWVLTMTTTGTNAPKHKKRVYPQGAQLDFYSALGVLQLTAEVVSATSTTLIVKLVAAASAVVPQANDICYWEGNKDGETVGLSQFAPVSAGTLYGISQTNNPQFRGSIRSITGTLDFGDINGIIADLEEEIQSPKVGITSHKAMKLLKDQAEDQKRYNASEIKSANGKVGFKGIEVMTSEGAIPLIASQFCPDDEMYFLDPKYMMYVMREDFGWFDDDGSILMRDPNKDSYNARFGGYFELFCSKPNTVGRVKGFTVS